MSIVEPSSKNIESSTSKSDYSDNKPQSFLENLKSQAAKWVLDVSKDFLIIAKVTVVFIVFIAADALIVFIIGLAFADAIEQIVFVKWLLIGVKIISALVIALNYVWLCAIELYKKRKDINDDSKNGEKGN